ncbi:MAG: hypothetical protein PUH24_06205 [Prevotellaceae bacterium]|nr:hypothetical protein [Prevotellaceae bacterium]
MPTNQRPLHTPTSCRLTISGNKVTADNFSAIIPAYRACIISGTFEAKELNFTLDDETTGLRAVETTDSDGAVRYYDLRGRYIGTSLNGQPQGVYVGNGKKVMRK